MKECNFYQDTTIFIQRKEFENIVRSIMVILYLY